MKHLLRKHWFRVLLVLIILAGAVVYWLWPRRYDITVSRETTYLLGPLHPDGTVNYVAAINQMYSEGITPENNAAVLLIRATGPTTINSEVRDAAFKRLGMEAPSETGDYFVGLAEYVSQQHIDKPSTDNQHTECEEQADKDLEKTLNAPWSAKDYPLIADWLRANEKPLALAVAASKCPRYYIPYLSLSKPPQVLDMLLPCLGRFRFIAKALTARAMLKADSGDIAAARADLMAAHRLARLFGQGPTLIDRLVAMNSERAACGGSAALAASGELTAAQAQAHLANLQSLPALPGVAEAMDKTERFMGLDMTATYARRSWKSKPFRLDWEELFEGEMKADWDKVLRKINYFYDMEVAAMRRETFSERHAALADFEDAWRQHNDSISIKKYKFLRSKDEAGKIIVGMGVACGLGEASVQYDEAVMHLRLVQVALALAAYKAEKGEYPETLAGLKPAYLKKIPNDLFIEKPLHYKRTDKGYLLYSVGPDMKDDGGKKQSEETPDCDDIVVKTR